MEYCEIASFLCRFYNVVMHRKKLIVSEIVLYSEFVLLV